MKRVVLAAAVAASMAMSSMAVGQAPPLLTGRVVSDQTGAPIANVQITMTSEGLGVPVVLSDADGRFSIAPGAPASRLIARKTGWAPTEIVKPSGFNEIRLRRGAAISGRVVDDAGEPVLAARVSVEPVARAAGSPPAVAAAETDDRGEYRLGGLTAGVYHAAVMTVGPPARRTLDNGAIVISPAVVKTYYPGVTRATGARVLTIEAGFEQTGIDFVVPASQSSSQPFSIVRSFPISPIQMQPDRSSATAVIRGVVADNDGRGLPYAQVVITPETSGVTDPRHGRAASNGRFEVRDLPPGRYRVAASKAGYFPLPSGDLRWAALLAQTRRIELAAGETRDDVEVRLSRWGTMEGEVLDEHGAPMQGASVQLLQVRYQAGRRRLVSATGAPRLTDDRGRYRLYGLRPGQYIVSATVADIATASVPGYARSYYPATAMPAQAVFVPLRDAQDVSGINIVLSRARTVRVSGKLLNAAGEQTTGGSVSLVPSLQSDAVTSVPVGARILSNTGEFEFPNVAPGLYVIQANRGRRNGWTEGEFGTMTVGVGETDVTDLVIRMSAGSSISGRISFDATDPTRRPARSAIEITPIPVDPDAAPPLNWANADVRSDWTFVLAGISGPRRLEVIRTPPGWALKDIRANGLDITDRPLALGRADQSLTGVEVVLTDRPSVLAGAVRGDGSRVVPDAAVLVFPTDRARWYFGSRFVRRTTTGADGAFTIEGLPFGIYYVAALGTLPEDGDDAWRDPARLESLIPRSSTATVRDAEKTTVALQLPSDRRRP